MHAIKPLSIFYRGSLSSCQYNCHYCPFAKKKDTRSTLQKDAAQLTRFVQWVKQYPTINHLPLRILFTPWGEALVRGYYRQALLELCTLSHVSTVAIQTNLHAPLSWMQNTHKGKLMLWCSFHPTQTTQSAFLKRCALLDKMSVPYSVGMVALRENFDAISAMRQALSNHVYMWLNAYGNTTSSYYTPEEITQLEQIDPWFKYNASPAPCYGKPCHAGENAIALDGDGNVTRCQFLKRYLGNLYQLDLSTMLQLRPCTRRVCNCYIGYAMRKDLPFEAQFGEGILSRIPLIKKSKQAEQKILCLSEP